MFRFLLLGAPLAAALVIGVSPASAEVPTTDEALRVMGFKESEKQQVLAGQFVEVDRKSTSDRDLAIALAFLIRKTPKELDHELVAKQLLIVVDPNTLGHGNFESSGTLANLSGLTLSAAEKKAFLGATAGESLNLSTQEIASLKALGGNEAAVDAKVRELLLARFRAYHDKGLGGIAAYARGDGKQRDAAADLGASSKAASLLKKYTPHVYQTLLDYPATRPEGAQEALHWTRYEAHGEPTLILTHAMSVPDGDAYVVFQRQYYVSGGYNVEQAVAGLLPVKEGTLVVYTNHTSTDQVAGFGGGTKRAIGRRVMKEQLEALFEKLRSAAEAG